MFMYIYMCREGVNLCHDRPMPIRPHRVSHPCGSGDDEVWLAEGLDGALIGYGEQAGQTVAVYDREKCLEILMERDGSSREAAEEHMSYNVAGTYLPGQTPVFLEHPDPDDMQAIRRPAGWA